MSDEMQVVLAALMQSLRPAPARKNAEEGVKGKIHQPFHIPACKVCTAVLLRSVPRCSGLPGWCMTSYTSFAASLQGALSYHLRL